MLSSYLLDTTLALFPLPRLRDLEACDLWRIFPKYALEIPIAALANC
jgi:hypothetical protein